MHSLMGINSSSKGKYPFPMDKFGAYQDFDFTEIMKITEKVIKTQKEEELDLEQMKTMKMD